MKQIVLLLVVTSFSFSCSPKQPPLIIEPVSNGFEVEVSTDGRPVTDFNQRLVHHLSLSENDLQHLRSYISQKKALPFNVTVERSLQGSVHGVRVLAPNSRNIENLGLKPEDLLTAVNQHQVRSLNDVALLFSALAKEGKASVTLMRAGKPHKLLYKVLH